MKKIKWGILSTARIGLQKVIPAMQQGEYCDIVAIASRDKGKAEEAAAKLNIPLVFSTYEELLQSKEVDAIYIPLPNHMHVPYAELALKNGKHVLCEKPIALSVAEAEKLADTKTHYPSLQLAEAFMYRYHPQWQKAKELAEQGAIGEVKTIQTFFSYFNADPNNIRNIKEVGGGGLMDIGCYCISQSRYILGSEPSRVLGIVEYDPSTHTDRLASGILDFGNATATFTCSTQLNPFQRFHVFGTKGSIEIEIPVNAPPDTPARIFLHKAGQPTEEIAFEAVNQYTLQGDAFSKAIIEGTELQTDFEDAINNMKVIEAIVESNKSGRWVNVI
ncbi:Gfo/Idh/MocA family protein [Desertivirga arenae]|uniref:Gfo/Idh/MocA family protein n=1 Tax=Desertivirga arenae TaxID=2810309 RepID=UPI001A96A92A|nr:Gfo/Idh/MocA family oxidoreductase [Pedobacter sp. SYSU D00823]